MAAEPIPPFGVQDRTDPASVERGRVVPPLVLPPGWAQIAVRLPDDAGEKINRQLRALEHAYPASPAKPGHGVALVVRFVRLKTGEWTATVTPEIPSEHIGRP